MKPDKKMTKPADGADPEAERRNVTPDHDQLTSVEAIVADGELTPPEKLERLKGWDRARGLARPEGYGRVADAADLGFPDPAPYSQEVQRAIVELYRLHRKSLPPADPDTWGA